MRLKLEYDASSSDTLLKRLLMEHKKLKFLALSGLFRERAKAKGMTVKDIMVEGRKIRDELYAEWFKD